jgi:hypothetical protein
MDRASRAQLCTREPECEAAGLVATARPFRARGGVRVHRKEFERATCRCVLRARRYTRAMLSRLEGADDQVQSFTAVIA